METTTQNAFEIEISEAVKKTKSIKLPYFVTDESCHVYKVFDKDHCMQVCYGVSVRKTIGVHHVGLAFIGVAKEITEEEFYEKFVEVSDYLKGIVI